MTTTAPYRVSLHQFYRRVHARVAQSKFKPTILKELDLSVVIKNYETVIVYGGLNSLYANSSAEAFGMILDAFATVKNLIFPAFTPSFRKTGVYSVLYSRPEVGSLSRRAISLGGMRTLDPIHSLVIARGELEKKDTLDDTFHPEGIFETFARQGACIVNIGTPEIVSTNLHYSERVADAPYLGTESHQGVIYQKNGKVERILHKSYKYKSPVAWNRRKIEQLWLENECVVMGRWNGASCRVIDGKKSSDCLNMALRRDPYYMVTF